jgi:hypothetical protein
VRPALKPALRILWRDDETLQLGLGPDGCVVLGGVDEAARSVLALLDGSRDLTAVLEIANRAGVQTSVAEGLIRLLDQSGALVDAGSDWGVLGRLSPLERERLTPELTSLSLLASVRGREWATMARRQRAWVRVLGGGRIGVPLAALLAAAGVGTVTVDAAGLVTPADVVPGGLAAADVGEPRERAAAEAVRAAAEGVRSVPALEGGSSPHLVVVTDERVGDPAVQLELRMDRQPHLAVSVLETRAVVGPLVLPGRSACVSCLDHERADRDPAWPLLSTQLVSRGGGPGPGDTVLAVLAAAVAAGQVLGFVDLPAPDAPPLPASVGGTLELSRSDWRLRRRSWALHPACGCAGAGQSTHVSPGRSCAAPA